MQVFSCVSPRFKKKITSVGLLAESSLSTPQLGMRRVSRGRRRSFSVLLSPQFRSPTEKPRDAYDASSFNTPGPTVGLCDTEPTIGRGEIPGRMRGVSLLSPRRASIMRRRRQSIAVPPSPVSPTQQPSYMGEGGRLPSTPIDISSRPFESGKRVKAKTCSPSCDQTPEAPHTPTTIPNMLLIDPEASATLPYASPKVVSTMPVQIVFTNMTMLYKRLVASSYRRRTTASARYGIESECNEES